MSRLKKDGTLKKQFIHLADGSVADRRFGKKTTMMDVSFLVKFIFCTAYLGAVILVFYFSRSEYIIQNIIALIIGAIVAIISVILFFVSFSADSYIGTVMYIITSVAAAVISINAVVNKVDYGYQHSTLSFIPLYMVGWKPSK
jgi:hypothetical protein